MAGKGNDKSHNKGSEKKTRTNTGHRGSRKTPRDEMALVIEGKGKMFVNFPAFHGHNYSRCPGSFGSFDMKQAVLNRSLGLC